MHVLLLHTANDTVNDHFQIRFGWLHFWVTIILLGTLILCTIVGNAFVVAAVLLEKHLQGVSNYLIVSLAVADLMVATVPMPLSVIDEVSERWWLGHALCDFWVCADVLCCTASILHLVGIALDRYWAVTKADYIRRRTAKRIGLMIFAFWLLSIAISIPARLDFTHLLMGKVIWQHDRCEINQEYGYTIFSTVGAFYMPMLFIIAIYARIYIAARSRIRHKKFQNQLNCRDAVTEHGKFSLTGCLNKKEKSSEKQRFDKLRSKILSKTNSVEWTTVNMETIIQVPNHSKYPTLASNSKSTNHDNFDNPNVSIVENKILSSVVQNENIVNDLKIAKENSQFIMKDFPLDNQPVYYALHSYNRMRIALNVRSGISFSAPASLDDVTQKFHSSSNSHESLPSASDRSESSEMSSSGSGLVHHRASRSAGSSRFQSLLKAIVLGKPAVEQNVANLNFRKPLYERRLTDAYRVIQAGNVIRTPGNESTAQLQKKKQMKIDNKTDKNTMSSVSVVTLPKRPHNSVVGEEEAVEKVVVNTENIKEREIKPTDLARSAALKRERMENKRERKAVITLSVITGCFILCWLPFFIRALVVPFSQTTKPSRIVHGITLWLGYSNSLCNPIIYTIFSPEFRGAFRKILFGKYYKRSRKT